MQSLEAKLARIQHYGTRYELAAIKDGRRVLVLYTARNNRQGLLSACRQVGDALVKFAGAENIQFGKRAADGATLMLAETCGPAVGVLVVSRG